MVLIDTHTHLYLDDYKDDIQEVVNNAIQNNVEYFLLPNIDGSTINKMNALCKLYPERMFPMIGLHPTSVKDNYMQELLTIRHELLTNKYYGIGEIGIDLHWDKSFRKEQEFVLRYQLELAKEFNLPIAIHTRSSFEEAIEIVQEVKDENLRGVFHCFGGSYQQALDIIEMGFFLGIGGVITFKNSGLDKVIDHISLENIILESDAPYLTPSPHRGLRNESSYLTLIAQKIAESKEISIEEVARITTKNAVELFNIKIVE
ncbi:MAG: TatD family hydrolase [Bacteroidetes bacterium]|nr:TatD family hydrolase [Bacteroidota bacterium]